MITRIEIDGFKSFRNFALDLQPFQVFIGPNGAGKSNLFDAIQLLSQIAGSETLAEAFSKGRGGPFDQFSALPGDTNHVQTMTFAVEMLVAHETNEAELEGFVIATRLRYELTIGRTIDKGLPKLSVQHEALSAISSDKDQWVEQHIPSVQRSRWIVRPETDKNALFIGKTTHGQYFVKEELYSQASSGRPDFSFHSTPGRSLLSFTGTVFERPTIYAARQEMLRWQTLHLQPEKLRQPGNLYAPDRLGADGANLLPALNRLATADPFILNDVERDMAGIIPGIAGLQVIPRLPGGQIELTVEMQDGTRLDSNILSDGTWRALALATLRHDPQHFGVLCLEEPETGVHPAQLKQIARLLQSMATTFEEEAYLTQATEPSMLRQVLISTHSPALLSAAPPESLWFVYMQNVQSGRTTTALPIQTASDNETRRFFTVDQVRRFLDAEPQEKAIEALGLGS